MRFLVDENIPFGREVFEAWGETTLKSGRSITTNDLATTDALIVRSVTQVNEELLSGTPVKFVGTATIGMDHIDRAYLKNAGIGFSSAPGCNAWSVVQWVVAAVAEIMVEKGERWIGDEDGAGKTIGIVGHGNIGGRLAKTMRGLGLRVLVNDPPLERRLQNADAEDAPKFPDGVKAPETFTPLETLLSEADIITFHTPLTRDGVFPTHHLCGARELQLIKPDAVILNASRGGVVDNAALLAALQAEGSSLTAALDTFEGEPGPRRDLVEACRFATPHIAGYSYEGKVNGCLMVAEAARRFFDFPATPAPPLMGPTPSRIVPTGEQTTSGDAAAPNDLSASVLSAQVLSAIRQTYDLNADDARMKEGMRGSEEEWRAHFDQLRREYPRRHEFTRFDFDPTEWGNPVSKFLTALGVNAV